MVIICRQYQESRDPPPAFDARIVNQPTRSVGKDDIDGNWGLDTPERIDALA